MVQTGESSKAAFGTYDLFAYLLPGTLLLGTVGITLTHMGLVTPLHASLPLDGAFLTGLVLSVVFTMMAYLTGLVAHQAGKTLEALPRNGPPSATILEEDRLLSVQIGAAVRSRLREKLGTDQHDDQQLWELAYRRVSLDGADQRVKQFQFLHTVTRGTSAIALLWVLLGIVYFVAARLFIQLTEQAAYGFGITWIVLGLIFAPTMYTLRGRFDHAVAREVILAYYMTRVQPDL